MHVQISVQQAILALYTYRATTTLHYRRFAPLVLAAGFMFLFHTAQEEPLNEEEDWPVHYILQARKEFSLCLQSYIDLV